MSEISSTSNVQNTSSLPVDTQSDQTVFDPNDEMRKYSIGKDVNGKDISPTDFSALHHEHVQLRQQADLQTSQQQIENAAAGPIKPQA